MVLDHPAFLLVWQENLKKENKMNDETSYTWEQWNTLIENYKRKGRKPRL